MKRFFLSFILFCISVSFATDYPVTVIDDLDNEIILNTAPIRIVSMIPSATEIVCALNACDLLVGRDQYSNYPKQVNDLPELGNGFVPNLEAIVALEPDLVIVDKVGELASQLRELDIIVYANNAETFEDVFDEFAVIGKLIDREKEAAFLTLQLRTELTNIHKLIVGAARPTVFYELDSTPYSVGPESFIGEIISLAGADNIVTADLGKFPKLDPEYIVAANPAIILLADAAYGESAETVALRAGWADISAISNARVYELSQEQVDKINRAGPRIVDALFLLAQIFHPDMID